MSQALAKAHILAQERLRTIVATAVGQIWAGLRGYDEQNVDQWLSTVVPVVIAGERQSVSLTEAYLARSIGRPALGINPDQIIGAGIRAGADPAEVYRRPFVTVWSALKDGTAWEDAVGQGAARATSTAATDVQLTMRTTLRDVGESDDLIVGYSRVPDGGACDFCQAVSGQRYRTDQLMPIHNHCGCGVDVITRSNRREFTGKPENDLTVTRDGVTAAVREHGELGPVLTDGSQHFTSEQHI